MNKIIIDVYTDGSGNSLDSDGGWGYVIVINGVKRYEKCGFLHSSTNNTAELTAAINGLNDLMGFIAALGINKDDCIITLVSDSQLVLNYAANKWKCKKDHLRTLNNTLQGLYNRLKVSGRWVKGHSGNVYNERCDELAGTARKDGRLKFSTYSFIKTLVRLKVIKSANFLLLAASKLSPDN